MPSPDLSLAQQQQETSPTLTMVPGWKTHFKYMEKVK